MKILDHRHSAFLPLAELTTLRLGGFPLAEIRVETLADYDLLSPVLEREGVDVRVFGGGSNLLAAEKFAAGRQCEISYIVKGERVHKDVKELICSVQAENPRTLRLRLRCGNRNLRADRLMRFWADSFGWGSYDVVKTNTYDENGVNLDKILFGSDK